MTADPIAAVVAVLLSDPDVNALVSGRVYGVELPESEASRMPRAAIVVSAVGGVGHSVSIQEVRCDLRCYGATPSEAMRVHLACYATLKHLARVVAAQTLIHGAVLENGPLTLRDPDVFWPFTLATWRVKVSEGTVV